MEFSASDVEGRHFIIADGHTFGIRVKVHIAIDLEIAVIGVPWDVGTSNRAGAHHGPREVRNMSSFMRRVHHLSRIADLGDTPVDPIDMMATMKGIEDFFRMGTEAVIAEARRVAGDGPTYVTFDVDCLDPAYAPGTGTPEIGGLSTFDAQQMVRGLRGLNLIGADVVEVSPPFDPTGNTALVGAAMMFEIMCVMADAVAKRREG